jgi:hypothetical protein
MRKSEDRGYSIQENRVIKKYFEKWLQQY